MKAVICIKQVPEVAELKFDLEKKTLIREGVPNIINPYDRCAILEGVRLKKAYGGEVVVVTMGPPQAQEALVEALAMGCDRAVHIVDRAFAGSDTLATARALSLFLQKEGFDLVLCGKFSVDAETGQVGPEVAELLNITHVTGLTKLEVDASGRHVKATRETDEGKEIVECDLPALLTASEHLVRAGPVPPAAMEAARSRPIEVLTAADLSQDRSLFGFDGSPTWVAEIYSVATERHPTMLDGGTIEEAVQALTEHLLEQGLFGTWKGARAVPRVTTRAADARPDRAVWVVGELLGGQVRSVTYELLGRCVELADRLHGDVCGVLIGHGLAEHAKALTAYGADRVLLIESPQLDRYSTEGYANALAQAIQQHRPYAVIVPSTAVGRDFVPRVAARLQIGLTGDAIGLEINEQDLLVQLKPAFGGTIVAPILSKTFPQMATVRPGMLDEMDPDWSREPVLERLLLDDVGPIRAQIVQVQREVDETATSLEEADIVVSVGMGMVRRENVKLARELAEVLGAPIGATRRVTDSGWLPRQHQVGLTGKAVAPKLYVALGIRGAGNHTIGIQRAQTIVAINKDPQSPIFQIATYGIVGDCLQVVPALTQALAEAKRRRQGP
ncbi:MAG: electron transfer flavoprotein alpha/ beta subunit [Nitrospinae bacterium]|nr:electron transfer flavoprotein alpha/ beta subunit [Nitrospinota bacterium]